MPRWKAEILSFNMKITFAYPAQVPRKLLIVKVRAFQRLITLTFQYLQLLVQLAAPGFRLSADPGSNPSVGISPDSYGIYLHYRAHTQTCVFVSRGIFFC